MIRKVNIPVRDCSRVHDVPLWRVADLMGISYSTLMQRIRHEWTKEEQERVIGLIEEYAKLSNERKTVD